MQFSTLLLTLVPAVSAHFRLNYPFWRGDSIALAKDNTSISQWNYPCAGIGQEESSRNRTAWPLTGGSVIFNSSHESTFVWVNLGMGDVVTSFNVSLVPVYNSSGVGLTCLPNPGRAAIEGLNITDGMTASVQVITSGGSGASLFNCADVVFRANASILSGDSCTNDTVGLTLMSTNGSDGMNHGGSSGGTNAAPRGSVPIAALFAAVGVGMYATL